MRDVFNEKEIEALRSEVADLRTLLQKSEEKRNAQYTDIMMAIKELTVATEARESECSSDWEDSDELDEWFDQVREFVVQEQKASTSLIQRHFKVGYGRAARLIDQLEEQGVIEESDGTGRPRKILKQDTTDDE